MLNWALLQSAIVGSLKSCLTLKGGSGSRWCGGGRGSPCGPIQAWASGLGQVVNPFNVTRLLICAHSTLTRSSLLADLWYSYCCCGCWAFHVVPLCVLLHLEVFVLLHGYLIRQWHWHLFQGSNVTHLSRRLATTFGYCQKNHHGNEYKGYNQMNEILACEKVCESVQCCDNKQVH